MATIVSLTPPKKINKTTKNKKTKTEMDLNYLNCVPKNEWIK